MPAKHTNKQPAKSAERPLIVTIKASEWARGHDATGKHFNLLNDDGTKCCLGFDGLACGVAPAKLKNKVYPASVLSRDKQSAAYREAWSGRPVGGTGSLAENLGIQAAAINDDFDINDDERIAALRPVFHAAHPPRIIRWLPNR